MFFMEFLRAIEIECLAEDLEQQARWAVHSNPSADSLRRWAVIVRLLDACRSRRQALMGV
jgi:hypothetical protein